MARQTDPTASSTGQAWTAGDWLDVHFEASRPEYEAMVRSVDFQPGWYVLDAGCGSGSFLPLLGELVGPSGRLVALDFAPDNLALVERRLAGWALPCPLEVRVGNVLALPYPDDTFDGLWCANVTQYLTDEELVAALAEFRRVVRPGGLVAVKDSDVSVMRAPRPDWRLLQHLWERIAEAGGRAGHAREARGPELRAYLRHAGLTEVWLRTTLMERWSPYRAVEREYLRTGTASLAALSERLDLPEAEHREWARLRELGDTILDDPDHYYRTAYVLAVGTVPGDTAREV